MNNRNIQHWVIPPESDAEYVACMEDVTIPTFRCSAWMSNRYYQGPRCPFPPRKQHPKRVDYEYERAGVANIPMYAEPLAGWREIALRQSKTKVDWQPKQLGYWKDAMRIAKRVWSEHAHERRFSTKFSSLHVPGRWRAELNSTTRPSMAARRTS